jgi:glycerol-1-phosphate dehydrogenase [NAD(P)+]
VTPPPGAGVESDERQIAEALQAAGDTRALAVEAGIRHHAAELFAEQFGSARAIVIADANTYAAAGADVARSFAKGRQGSSEPFVFGAHIHAEYSCIRELDDVLRHDDAIPVAVGSGTINDLTKLAAHRAGRPYMVVATAASVDGYTSYGASITRDGAKQTFDCPAPRAVLADLEVIAGAPRGMNASGYADLLAKRPAGADWILAEAAGEEPIHEGAWRAVQGPLRAWLAAPEQVAAGDPLWLRRLVYGLMMSGFAMQGMRSSRPASGAEHQFSHLWDMQGHRFEGEAPSHGFKVGIGTLASLALYDKLLELKEGDFDIEGAVEGWPSPREAEARLTAVLGEELAVKAREETQAKQISRERLRAQLERLREKWSGVRRRIERHLPRRAEAREMLRAAGCPWEPEQIGISRERLRRSYEEAWYIRRRYTVLDFARRAGMGESLTGAIFGAGDAWPIGTGEGER